MLHRNTFIGQVASIQNSKFKIQNFYQDMLGLKPHPITSPSLTPSLPNS